MSNSEEDVEYLVKEVFNRQRERIVNQILINAVDYFIFSVYGF